MYPITTQLSSEEKNILELFFIQIKEDRLRDNRYKIFFDDLKKERTVKKSIDAFRFVEVVEFTEKDLNMIERWYMLQLEKAPLDNTETEIMNKFIRKLKIEMSFGNLPDLEDI